MAGRSTRPHGPHDQGERGALPEGDGQSDFKTASQEYIFETAASAGETEVPKSELKEWMKPVEAPVPRFLAETGDKAMIYREPYGVALIIGPFNGPLLLLIRPAIAVLAAGNTCVLKPSEALTKFSALLA